MASAYAALSACGRLVGKQETARATTFCGSSPEKRYRKGHKGTQRFTAKYRGALPHPAGSGSSAVPVHFAG